MAKSQECSPIEAAGSGIPAWKSVAHASLERRYTHVVMDVQWSSHLDKELCCCRVPLVHHIMKDRPTFLKPATRESQDSGSCHANSNIAMRWPTQVRAHQAKAAPASIICLGKSQTQALSQQRDSLHKQQSKACSPE